MKVKAAAKINLMLDIVNKRPDGYHDLFMIMQSVDLFDDVTVELTESKKIVLTCNVKDIPVDQRNIAYKAALAFFNATKIKDCGVKIHVEKCIPFAAGLAGGSADGAAVIVALNELLKTNLTEKELCKIGVTVGADVPFCIVGGTLLAQGIGDVLSDLKPLPECYIVLAKPEYGVDTAKAYSHYDKCDWCYKPDKLAMLTAVMDEDLNKISTFLSNSFEQFVEVPDRVHIKSVMTECGALGSCMSGSGPTVFGIFDSKERAKTCKKALSEFVKDVFVCRPAKKGCIIE